MINILNIKELGKLEIVEIYDFYDQPILYSCRNAAGHLFLVIAAAEDDQQFTWLCVAVSVERLNLIRIGVIDLHDAFAHPEVPYVIQVKVPYKEHYSIQTDFLKLDQIPKEMLPISGEYLDLEVDELPILSNSEELLRIGNGEILDICHKGSKTQVPIGYLSKIFKDLQNVINAIGSELLQTNGITDYIKNLMELSLCEVGTGSFKFRIVPTNNLGLFGYTDCGNAIEEFLRLVNASDNQTELSERLGRLKSKVAEKYTEFLKSLDQSGTDTEFNWTSPKSEQTITIYVSNSQIREVITLLKKYQEEAPFKRTISGTLMSGSLKTNKLEINTSEKPYRGIIIDDKFKNIVPITLGEEYIAEIQEVPVKSETTGEITKTEYRLLSLSKKKQVM